MSIIGIIFSLFFPLISFGKDSRGISSEAMFSANRDAPVVQKPSTPKNTISSLLEISLQS